MVPEDVQRALPLLREDYARVTGKPFNHFYCPILCKDEEVKLCMGHIVNQAIANSSRSCVVQRADVDGFFGTVVESDFVTMACALRSGLREVLSDPDLSKKLKPKIMVDGEEFRHFHYKGHFDKQEHTPFLLENREGDGLRLVLQRNPEVVTAAQGKQWAVVVEADFRVCYLASLIKAAYLTLFRLLGYSYVLSAAGQYVGHDILGGFFRAAAGMATSKAKRVAADYFRQYVHMVRPIVGVGGTPPQGTIEDYQAQVCFGSSGRPFGLVVCVRVNTDIHAVLMPDFGHPDSVEAYLYFMRNEQESLRTSGCVFNVEKGHWEVSDQPTEVVWPKKDQSFEI